MKELCLKEGIYLSQLNIISVCGYVRVCVSVSSCVSERSTQKYEANCSIHKLCRRDCLLREEKKKSFFQAKNKERRKTNCEEENFPKAKKGILGKANEKNIFMYCFYHYRRRT